MKKYIQKQQPGFFDADYLSNELSAIGDPLHRLNKTIDWSVFDPILNSLPSPKPKGAGGRPCFHVSLLFKMLVVQSLYNLSDAQMEFQTKYRLTFKSFLGLEMCDAIPDEKTIWAFRDKLCKHGLFEKLFAVFALELKTKGLIANKGKIIDATFVDVPKQRNSRDENAAIKKGEMPPSFAENPHKLAQKDVDARWTKKNDEKHYGYKNHVKVDAGSKLIDAFEVTAASVHDSDSDVLEKLVKEGDPTTFVDSAYAGPRCEELFKRKNVTALVVEKGRRNNPLTKSQKELNKLISSVRVRVEHVFGSMAMSMKAFLNRCIGKVRNKGAIALANLVYNMIRYEQIKRLGLMKIPA